jgi:hypothetical protein
MTEVNSTHSAVALFSFICLGFYGCVNETTKNNTVDPILVMQDSTKIASPDSIKSTLEGDEISIMFTDAIHFQKVKQYLEEVGKHDSVSISALAGDTSMMVDYYSIDRKGWNITKDHHTRIYFSYDSHSYGSIFLVDDSVHVEPYYIGPKETIDTLHEIIQPITKLYNTLVNEARKEQ